LTEPLVPHFLWDLVTQLRRRRLVIGVDDCEALRRSLQAGFGWASEEALRELCVALWATSRQEAEIVRAVFARVEAPTWNRDLAPTGSTEAATPFLRSDRPVPTQQPDEGETESRVVTGSPPMTAPGTTAPDRALVLLPEYPLTPREVTGLPPMTLPGTTAPDRALVLLPEYPLTPREVAQVWRRLRRPQRLGPATELDIDATVRQAGRTGLATPPVTVPPRRNMARLLLLVDRQGSMTPFDHYVDVVCDSIEAAGRLDQVNRYYFHNCPVSGADPGPLEDLANPFNPELDAALPLIEPCAAGRVYVDPQLSQARPLPDVLAACASGTLAVVISDAGAARGGYSTLRLLDTLAMAKALRASVTGYVWLNPVPRARWPRTTAEQLGRHLPMFPFDKAGMNAAVDALRGHPVALDRPL
jgi:hypothetical protein